MDCVSIGNKEIGPGKPTFIIAEAGVNHNGDLEIAKKLVHTAKEAGADAVKFQTFHAEDVVTAGGDMAAYQVENIGKKGTQQDMLRSLELPDEAFGKLKKLADEIGISFMSTSHSNEVGTEVLDAINIPAYKVGSGDLTNIPFLEYLAGRGKPIIWSTGMGTMEECKEAAKAIQTYGNPPSAVLHCTTSYPCALEHVNLRAMQTIEKELDCLVGYSDHTPGIGVSLLAVALGACVIEKHFTLNKEMDGPDHKASLDPREFKKLVEGIRLVENKKIHDLKDLIPILQSLDEPWDDEKIVTVLGSGEKTPFPVEIDIAKVVRKSIVTRIAISKGTTITRRHLVIKRPGTGIHPGNLGKLIGRIAKINIEADTLLNKSNLK